MPGWRESCCSTVCRSGSSNSDSYTLVIVCVSCWFFWITHSLGLVWPGSLDNVSLCMVLKTTLPPPLMPRIYQVFSFHATPFQWWVFYTHLNIFVSVGRWVQSGGWEHFQSGAIVGAQDKDNGRRENICGGSVVLLFRRETGWASQHLTAAVPFCTQLQGRTNAFTLKGGKHYNRKYASFALNGVRGRDLRLTSSFLTDAWLSNEDYWLCWNQLKG